MNPELVSRARGALLGLVAGNQLGVPTEHLGTPEAIRKAYPNGVWDLAPPPKNSPYDDDAAMTLLLGAPLGEVDEGGRPRHRSDDAARAHLDRSRQGAVRSGPAGAAGEPAAVRRQ